MRTFLIGVIALSFASCGEEKPAPKKQLTKEQMNDLSVQMNSWDSDRQRDEIEQYIRRRGWKMNLTASGIYWMTLAEGKGDSARVGQTASVSYDIYLLDGTECYSSDSAGPRDVHIGEDYVESGLHEALQMMKSGEKKRFILPSHLAHGLTGDQEKIPPRSSVVYEVEVHSIR
jgi:FKBP-type peptidyl-prolyl cis-trans isomerase FkpA